MTVVFVGAAALGLVAGWWSAPLVAARAPWRTWTSVSLATALLAVEEAWLAGPRSVIPLLISFAAALAAHTIFRATISANLAHQRR